MRECLPRGWNLSAGFKMKLGQKSFLGGKPNWKNWKEEEGSSPNKLNEGLRRAFGWKCLGLLET